MSTAAPTLAAPALNVLLPYPIVEKHGKDFRDWANEGHTTADLLELLAAATPITTSAELSASEDDEDLEPNKAIDDPHRLARANLDRYADLSNGGTVKSFRNEWYTWKPADACYKAIVREDFEAKINASIEIEFNRANIVEQMDWDERRKEDPESAGDRPIAKKVTKALVSNVIQASSSIANISSELDYNTHLPSKQRRNWVAMQNGIFDVDAFLDDRELDDVLLPHTSDWFSTVRLPYDFDHEAACPRWETVLHRCMNGDQELLDVLQEWAGYLLLPDTSQQKFVVNEGEGGNGKSVFTSGITALLGPDNVSNVALDKFGNQFDLGDTLGKLANICGDMGEVDRIAEGQLKAFTGGDRMFFDRKHLRGVNSAPTARLMFNTNTRPRFSDKSSGIWRRILLIPWDVTITASERVLGMDRVDWWQASGELPGIFLWALRGLHRLRLQKSFSHSRRIEEGIASYRREVNPAREFLLEHCEAMPGHKVRCEMIYAIYRKWTEQKGNSPMADTHFGREVKRCFVDIDRKKGGGRTDRFWFYDGMRFTTDLIAGEKTDDATLF